MKRHSDELHPPIVLARAVTFTSDAAKMTRWVPTEGVVVDDKHRVRIIEHGLLPDTLKEIWCERNNPPGFAKLLAQAALHSLPPKNEVPSCDGIELVEIVAPHRSEIGGHRMNIYGMQAVGETVIIDPIGASDISETTRYTIEQRHQLGDGDKPPIVRTRRGGLVVVTPAIMCVTSNGELLDPTGLATTV